MGKRKFYHSGLYFSCTECGNCCSDTGGYVELSEAEAQRIGEFLGLSEADFLDKFIDVPHNAASLRLTSYRNGDCIFLSENRCSVYPVRPLQCRTFPFWPENIKSDHRWKLIAAICPGINQGRLHTEAEIESILDLMKKKE